MFISRYHHIRIIRLTLPVSRTTEKCYWHIDNNGVIYVGGAAGTSQYKIDLKKQHKDWERIKVVSRYGLVSNPCQYF